MERADKVRVAVLVSHLTIGGAEQLLLELLRHIDRRKFDIHIFFLREPGILGKEVLQLGYPVSTGIIRSKFDLSGVSRLAQMLKGHQTEVLFLINHLNTLFYGVLAAGIARVRLCINWENETFKKYPFHSLTMLGRRILHWGIDYVVAAAKGHGDYIAAEEKIPYSKIRVIYNGVDPQRFQSKLSPQEAKERLGLPAQSSVVSIVAALRPDKAHQVFLKAAKKVRDTVADAHFLIIGDGPQRQYLEKLSGELQLNGHVHFLGFQRGLGDIFAAVDINCLSSYPQQETLSVAGIEAMSAGVPMVCTDVGFMNEIVIADKTGFLVPVDDPDALAERLIFVLRNQELKRQMGENARQMVYDMLSIDKMTASFAALMMSKT